ncbi:MAG TPA: ATP-binding protein [Streptosporangiaceae bacterium]
MTDWFPGEAAAVGQARKFVCGVLGADWPGLPDVLLMVSEIATNAVRYAESGDGGWFDLTVSVRGRTLRIAVAERGGPAAPRIPCEGGDPGVLTSGRGLRLVDDLADAWGCAGDTMGRVLWFEISWQARWVTASPCGILPGHMTSWVAGQ